MGTGSDRPRVVVTGIGLVTGLGPGREATWQRLCDGQSAARWLDVPTAPGETPYAGFPLPGGDHRPIVPVLDAAREALRDAGLEAIGAVDPDRAATVIGLSKGDLNGLAIRHKRLIREGPGAADAAPALPDTWPDAAAGRIAGDWGVRGPCLAPVAACATGVVAALRAAALIRRGACDVALAGSGDASLEPLVLAAFRRMRVLARVDGDPAAAVRPCDRRRSGFLVGEGAAVLVLEREDRAHARGVLVYAELAGGALGADAFHETNLDPDPTNLAGLIGRALDDAGLAPTAIDHVNLHGTATRANDPLECRALRRALGGHADRVSCSANKGQIGHLLGAAGAAELAITCLALRDGFVPPTANLAEPDPECDLDATPMVGRRREIGAALKLSLGFGGHLAAAVLRRPDGPRRGPEPTP